VTFTSHIFREYDIRGLADTELDDELAYHLGRAFATKLRRENKKTISVGYDLRQSSTRIFSALAKGLVESHDQGGCWRPWRLVCGFVFLFVSI